MRTMMITLKIKPASAEAREAIEDEVNAHLEQLLDLLGNAGLLYEAENRSFTDSFQFKIK